MQFCSSLFWASDPMTDYGPLFLCWFLGVVPFNTWHTSSWEENKCYYKLSKCKKWHLFQSVEVVILSLAQLVTTAPKAKTVRNINCTLLPIDIDPEHDLPQERLAVLFLSLCTLTKCTLALFFISHYRARISHTKT